jgi:large subunit ribosomal protein L21
MYAVFEDGSRQYRVSVGDVVRVDYRDGIDKGARVEFPRVLLSVDGAEATIGQPVVPGVRVVGEVVDFPSIKYTIQHFRRRKNSRRLKGHRQHFTSVKILHILPAGQEAPPPAPAPAPVAPPPAPAATAPAS